MKTTAVLITAMAVTLLPLAGATTQIGDLRLNAATYSTLTYFDPASAVQNTRGVIGAPVAINSQFVAVSQNTGGASPDSATDIGLQTFSTSTTIRQLNRYTSDADGPGPATGPQAVGAVQWTINLTPLGSYLSSNNLDLTALNLRLVTSVSDGTAPYDVYLSYTRAAESITQASISTSTTAGPNNYTNFWFPAQGTAEGAIANGTHKVFEKGFTGPMDLTINLLALYDAGVTNVNLIMTSGGFLSGRTININEGSGVSMSTVVIPEPSAAWFAVLGFGVLFRRSRI